MPKTPVRVFWRGADGNECVLRSTDQGWEVAVVADDGQPIKKERVSGSKGREPDRRALAAKRRAAEHITRTMRFWFPTAACDGARYPSANRGDRCRSSSILF